MAASDQFQQALTATNTQLQALMAEINYRRSARAQQLETETARLQSQMVSEALNILREINDAATKPQRSALLTARASVSQVSAMEKIITSKFATWARKVENFITGVFGQDLWKAMKWAAEQECSINDANIVIACGASAADPNDRVQSLQNKVSQLRHPYQGREW
eukprot:TRINITY_DN94418_c0_g1_i1.p2 TRINITY_DN94418_c0_g1~~TRINITY_DN94418_c0_g1_i1.p2  ORF type:complete len:164 (-),score=39.46 TRINITY_DN94418_c0_g1_i1:380-871(-)